MAKPLKRRLWAATLLGLSLGCLVAAPALARPRGETIALTFDDLPGLTNLDDEPYIEYFNATLIAGLRRHHFPATAFVNEGRLDDLDRTRQTQILRSWITAGFDLGNHTFSHESPNTIGAHAYIADIARGEPVTRGLMAEHGRELRWFRHPYLETGSPRAKRELIDHWLAAHHYRVAPVTADANDWEYAEPYDDAIARHDAHRVARIRAQYLDRTDRILRWSQQAARALFGHGIPLVMLLHDSRLNADCIDDLARLLKRNRLHPVSLDEAMKDPAYRTADHYAGRNGDDWLSRWSTTLHRDLPWATYMAVQPEIVREYNAVDTDQLISAHQSEPEPQPEQKPVPTTAASAPKTAPTPGTAP